MATLSAEDRAIARKVFSQRLSEIRQVCGLSKAEILAAVNAVDQWIHDNQASFLAAFPEPAASTLTNKQKARLFLRIVDRRFEVM